MLLHFTTEDQSSVVPIHIAVTAKGGAFGMALTLYSLGLASSIRNYRLTGLERTSRGQPVFPATIR